MPSGAIVARELVVTARHRGLFSGRAALALGLLLVIYLNYRGWTTGRVWPVGARLPAGKAAAFGLSVFLALAGAQLAAVVGMTPGLVAGAIAGEVRRKTLHYVLASRLTSLEIVLGKLAARLLHLASFLAVGLPVMSLLTLLGGVDPALVALAYGAMASTAFFLAALAILASVFAQDPRAAAGLTHGMTVLWLIGPMALDRVLVWWWPGLHARIDPAIDWVGASSPFTVFVAVLRARGNLSVLLTDLAWMMGLQVLYGVPLVLLAAWQLRPAFRRREGRAAGGLWRALASWRWRLRPRPACGDDAMLWKEMYTSRTHGVTKLVAALLVLGLLGLLAWATAEFAIPAFRELYAHGYGAGPDLSRQRFNGYLRMSGTFLYVVWMLALTSSAASSVVLERERDTWTSLLSTPLDGREILRAKALGALWTTRGFAYVLLALWGLGLLAGAVHPLGLAAVLVEAAVFARFAAAVGTYFSLRAPTVSRAQNEATLVIFGLNGYLLCGLPLIAVAPSPPPAIVGAGCTPLILGASLVSYQDVRWWFSHGTLAAVGTGPNPWSVFVMCLVGLAGYAFGAYYFTAAAIGAFDEAADRPRRRPGRPAPSPPSGARGA